MEATVSTSLCPSCRDRQSELEEAGRESQFRPCYHCDKKLAGLIDLENPYGTRARKAREPEKEKSNRSRAASRYKRSNLGCLPVNAQRLKELREKAGLDRQQLSLKAGLGKSAVSDYERNAREIGRSAREKLSQVLGCDPMELVK